MLKEVRSTGKNGTQKFEEKRPSCYPRSQPVLPSPPYQSSVHHHGINCSVLIYSLQAHLQRNGSIMKGFRFIYAFVLIENRSTVSHRPVTAHLQPVTDHSPTIRRPVSTDRKPFAVRTVNSWR